MRSMLRDHLNPTEIFELQRIMRIGPISDESVINRRAAQALLDMRCICRDSKGRLVAHWKNIQYFKEDFTEEPAHDGPG